MQIEKIVLNFKQELEELEARYKKDLEQNLVRRFKKIFDKHSELTSFSWTQYTPYFNDGYPCEFSLHGWRVTEEEVGWRSSRDSEYPELAQLFDAIESAPRLMELVYGDHCKVTVYRTHVEIDEYEHD